MSIVSEVKQRTGMRMYIQRAVEAVMPMPVKRAI